MKNKTYFSSLIVGFILCISQLNAQLLCPAPTNLTTGGITSNSAIIAWFGQPNTGTFEYRYRISGPNNLWTSGTSILFNANLAGLTSATLYEWKVRTVCPNSAGSVTYSAWSVTAFFTTLSGTGCPIPAGLYANNITTNSALLHWGSTGASNYKIRYRPIGSLAWTVKYSTTNNKSITGLNPATAYQWQVQGKCIISGVVTWGGWSTLSVFQTPGATTCAVPAGLTSTTTMGNGVTLTWISVGAMSHNIRYRSLNSLNWISTTSVTNTKTLTGLAGGTGFEWQVQSVCGINGAVVTSAWSASAFFTTNAPLSPNPARDRIAYNHNSRISQDVQLIVRDFFGTTYISEKRNTLEGDNQLELNIGNLKNGLYYLEMIGKDGSQISKFFVQH